MEEWLPCPGYENYYEVSSLGRVRSRARVIRVTGRGARKMKGGRIRRVIVDKVGYVLVNLSRDGAYRRYLVHRLVAKAFLVRKPGKDQVNHINFDKGDNRLVNLEWVTRSENQLHSVRGGQGIYGKPGWKIQDRLSAKRGKFGNNG